MHITVSTKKGQYPVFLYKEFTIRTCIAKNLLIFFVMLMTSRACCRTGVGEVHIIYLNNSLVKVKVITVANN